MNRPIKKPPRLAPGTAFNNYSSNSNNTTAEVIAHALDGRQTGPGKWRAKCPAHDDRNPSFDIKEGDTGPLFICRTGCTQDEVLQALRDRGLWRTGKVRAIPKPDKAAELWQVALRHLTHGEPLHWPPYTKSLPKIGQVWIVTGPNAWAAAQSLKRHHRHALVWPFSDRDFVPCIAYRWPVAGRDVVVMDTANEVMPDHGWNSAVQHFGRLLVSRWHAATAAVYGDFEPVTYRSEVRHAA